MRGKTHFIGLFATVLRYFKSEDLLLYLIVY